MRRTKIVCTLGPAVDSESQIKALIEAGMNVARLNCSHGDWESKQRLIDWVRKHSPEVGRIGLLADLQGPKFRIGSLPDEGLEIEAGQTITLGPSPAAQVPIGHGAIWEAMGKGDTILLGDGEIALRILDKSDEICQAKVQSGGTVRAKRGITLVGKSFDVPCITKKDRADLEAAAKAGVDFIALSYVRSAADMHELRELVNQFDKTIKLVAKVETKEALKDIDEIIEASDVIMVARGDLGLQMSLDDVPIAQKRIIAKCGQSGTPVITATQMLESMMVNARPTRAEASDVANAILDGTDAVMLSGETAAGHYPIECVATMARIAEKAESLFEYEHRLMRRENRSDETDSVAHAAVHLAASMKVKAIVTISMSGHTPRMVSKYRPRNPIYCACWEKSTQGFLSVVWGVNAALTPSPAGSAEMGMMDAVEAFVRKKMLKEGEKVVITCGVPPGVPGNTNLILVQSV